MYIEDKGVVDKKAVMKKKIGFNFILASLFCLIVINHPSPNFFGDETLWCVSLITCSVVGVIFSLRTIILIIKSYSPLFKRFRLNKGKDKK